MQQIVEELRNDGEKIEQVAVSANKITGISLDKESMDLGKGKTKPIKVTLEGPSEPYTYYAVVEGKYYKMSFNGGGVTIDRTPSEVSNDGEGTTITLTAISENEEIATVIVDNETNTVNVTAKEQAGTVAITVTYGSYSKTCNVRVSEVATELEINSVRARIAKDYTRWLTATAKPEATASQEFEWSSSDTSIATVDNKGVVTAKNAGTATITVKATDGSNLSKTCEVTIVENAPDVATLMDFQTQNTVAKDENGNLITVPGDFKVLTSEGTKVTQGIVIQDREENEFVWVPVDSVSTGTSKPADDIRLGRYTFDTKNGTPTKHQDADEFRKLVDVFFDINGYNYIQELTQSDTLKDSIAKNLEQFIENTKKNGGYYLARYEAGEGQNGKALSQTRKQALLPTHPKAAYYARNMYNSLYIESDLVNSYAWDTAIVFIQKFSKNSNYANKRNFRKPE